MNKKFFVDYAVYFFCRFIFFKSIRRNIEYKVIKDSGLFDFCFYKENNPDVNGDLLVHYIKYGDKEGRLPNKLFDPKIYKKNFVGFYVTDLFDYCLVGYRKEGKLSKWFDNGFYNKNNKDVKKNDVNPLLHYLADGGLEGRSPNVNFDGEFYLKNNPDVLARSINPLIHYIDFGIREGRASNARRTTSKKAISSVKTADIVRDNVNFSLDNIENNRVKGENVLAVIIPVYDDRELTWKCISSVIKAKNSCSFELIVVDDSSPNALLSKDLVCMRDAGLIELIINKENLGFVKTVNKAIESTNLDVIILNSDTEVFDFWIDKLLCYKENFSDVGSVTPLSNSATICSYPVFCEDNDYPLEVGFDVIDDICSDFDHGAITAPTGVGFCMFMPRKVIDDIGLFDYDTFGKGYGEENDWCQRAIIAGYKNYICPNLFVVHHGGASFKGEKVERVNKAIETINKKYNNYNKEVQGFVCDDPLHKYRKSIDLKRLELESKENNVVFVSHDRGGGAIQHIEEDAKKYIDKNWGVFYLRPKVDNSDMVEITSYNIPELVNVAAMSLDSNELCLLLRNLKINKIYSHGLVDFTSQAPRKLLILANKIGADFNVDIHDYKVICPRINLIDKGGVYCQEPDAKECNKCLRSYGNDFNAYDISLWRNEHLSVLKEAKSIVVPDIDVKNRLGRYFPDLEFEVQPHELVLVEKPEITPETDRVKCVVIGAISDMKGYNILLETAKYAYKRKLNIDFIVMGYTKNDAELKKYGVEITGKYQDCEALSKLVLLEPDVVWFPATWPETYSYTLSIALKSKRPIIAFDIGAIPSRLRQYGVNNWIIPFSDHNKTGKLVKYIINFREFSDI